MRRALITVFASLLAVALIAPGAHAASKRGAVLVKDINPGKSSSTGGSPDMFVNVAGTLFFAAGDRRHGTELWRSDGTRSGTRMVKDIRPGPRPCATSKPACRGQGASSYPSGLTAVGKTVYFTTDNGIHGNQLWRSNGKARGTRLVTDVNLEAGYTYFGPPAEVAGALFYLVGDQTHTQLWRGDGTPAGTTFVMEFGQRMGQIPVGETLYLVGADGRLWRSDGTASGTVVIGQFQGFSYPTDVAGTLFFTVQSPSRGELWRTDGTAPGTTLVKEGVIAHSRAAIGGTLYFTTLDFSDSWLWRSDGTEAGTIQLTSVGPSPEADALWPQLTNVAGTLYFVRNGPPPGYSGATLMRTDGTASGTRELRRGIIPRQLTAVGKTLYFEGYDKRHGNELWRSDGTPRGTRLVRDIRRGAGRRGAGSSSPDHLTAVGKTLFFSANDAVHGAELWRAGAKPRRKGKPKRKKG
jgi:ELWxxDGT repeat protein